MSTLRDPFAAGAWVLADPFDLTISNVVGQGSWSVQLQAGLAGAGVAAERPRIQGTGSWGIVLAASLAGSTEIVEAGEGAAAHRPRRHGPRGHQPRGHAPRGARPSAPPPDPPPPQPPSPAVGSHTVDWATLVYASRSGVERQYPSYEFSNGRSFYQPEDVEL